MDKVDSEIAEVKEKIEDLYKIVLKQANGNN